MLSNTRLDDSTSSSPPPRRLHSTFVKLMLDAKLPTSLNIFQADFLTFMIPYYFFLLIFVASTFQSVANSLSIFMISILILTVELIPF
jgi:hypothetical protein